MKFNLLKTYIEYQTYRKNVTEYTKINNNNKQFKQSFVIKLMSFGSYTHFFN